MGRWKNYRILVVLYAATALVATLDFNRAPDALVQADLQASRVLEARYPEFPRHVYHDGLRALEKHDYAEARRLFEKVLAARFYTDESFLYNHVLLLMHMKESQEEIGRAVELWRKHFPHSKNPDPRDWSARRESAP